jgi:di/tricarboxylate transporter
MTKPGFALSPGSLSAVLTAASLAAGAAVVALLPAGVDMTARLGLGVVVTTVVLMATGALNGLAISAIFFALALVTSTAPVTVLLSGFWANATLLIFGGLVIGTAAQRSGLGAFVARALLGRFLGSYMALLTGILVGAGALSFLVPSTMGRLAITLPVVMGLARDVGYETGSRGWNGVVLTTVVGNFLTAYGVLPGNLIGVIVHGAAEAVYGRQHGYLAHLLMMGPILGLLKGATVLLLVRLLFPAPPPRVAAGEAQGLTPAGRRLAVLLAATMTLWATDFLHGLKPGWIAAVAGLLCMAPPIALVRPIEALERNRLYAVVSVPAVLGLAAVLTHSGAGALISATILGLVDLAGQSQAAGFATIAVVTSFVSLIATTIGAVAIVTPLLGTVEAATGLSIKAGIVAEMVGLQCLFFHYEAVPIIVGIGIGQVSPGTAARLMVPLALTGFVVVLPAAILWLKLLGVLA